MLGQSQLKTPLSTVHTGPGTRCRMSPIHPSGYLPAPPGVPRLGAARAGVRPYHRGRLALGPKRITYWHRPGCRGWAPFALGAALLHREAPGFPCATPEPGAGRA
jgi:hypothetical protein